MQGKTKFQVSRLEPANGFQYRFNVVCSGYLEDILLEEVEAHFSGEQYTLVSEHVLFFATKSRRKAEEFEKLVKAIERKRR